MRYSNLSKPWKGASADKHHLQYKVSALQSTSERGFSDLSDGTEYESFTCY